MALETGYVLEECRRENNYYSMQEFFKLSIEQRRKTYPNIGIVARGKHLRSYDPLFEEVWKDDQKAREEKLLHDAAAYFFTPIAVYFLSDQATSIPDYTSNGT